jgi:hypothetical protein
VQPPTVWGYARKRLSVTVRQEECARKPGPNRTAASRHHHATRKSGRVDASVLPRTSGLVVVVVVVNVKSLIARLSSSSSYISYSSFFHRHPLPIPPSSPPSPFTTTKPCADRPQVAPGRLPTNRHPQWHRITCCGDCRQRRQWPSRWCRNTESED